MELIDKHLKKQINIKGINNQLINKDDFKFKKIIGDGATSIVYKAKYIRNEQYYAIKVIPKMNQDTLFI